MKHLMIMSLSILVLMIGTNHAIAQDDNDKYSYTTLEVSMDCNACVEKVQTQLAYTKGVKDVKADHVKDEVKVKYVTKKCSEEDLIGSLAEIDYKAKVKHAILQKQRLHAQVIKKKHVADQKLLAQVKSLNNVTLSNKLHILWGLFLNL